MSVRVVVTVPSLGLDVVSQPPLSSGVDRVLPPSGSVVVRSEAWPSLS
jgi:hypothetical protein